MDSADSWEGRSGFSFLGHVWFALLTGKMNWLLGVVLPDLAWLLALTFLLL